MFVNPRISAVNSIHHICPVIIIYWWDLPPDLPSLVIGYLAEIDDILNEEDLEQYIRIPPNVIVHFFSPTSPFDQAHLLHP